MNIAAVILAAGESKRLGQPKQLVRLQDEALVDRAVRAAREASVDQIVVVLGASDDEIRRQAKLEATVVTNQDWNSGMASSIHCGLDRLTPEMDAVILLNCDQPAVNATHLKSLVDALDKSTIAASTYADRIGTPAAFLREHFQALKSLRGDRGAREILLGDDVAKIPLPDGEFDIDTPADLERLQV